jgi:transposase
MAPASSISQLVSTATAYRLAPERHATACNRRQWVRLPGELVVQLRHRSFGSEPISVPDYGPRRFDTPRQLMAFLGLVPGERSTGDTVRRTGLTLAGNRRARRVLVEAAWTYRFPARVSQTLQARLV